MEGESQKNQENPTLFKLSIRNLSNVTLILPLTGLFVCFVSGWVTLSKLRDCEDIFYSDIVIFFLDIFFKMTKYMKHIAEWVPEKIFHNLDEWSED